ncbi:hypothetical protein [uncultured Deefgea sp.]|uniref:hypothetical protein n=1 Tax=uncultured Deefgea sp. TaxID=1304914 RepID=UPI0026323625|nr:hypothetical protein [uncultured Deefgea sp.]
MRDITAELKALRLHGMAGAWVDLKAQGGLGIDTSGWLIEHLLQAENTDRGLRSIPVIVKLVVASIVKSYAIFCATFSRL